MRNTIVITLFSVIFFSCDPSAYYREVKDFGEKGWVRDSVATFHFQVEQTDPVYDFRFQIRNSLNYTSYNIFVKYALMNEQGDTLLSDMPEFHLFDPRTGVPFGGGLGDIFDHSMPLLDSVRFDEPGNYQIALQHYMRPDTLSHVLSAGVKIDLINIP